MTATIEALRITTEGGRVATLPVDPRCPPTEAKVAGIVKELFPDEWSAWTPIRWALLNTEGGECGTGGCFHIGTPKGRAIRAARVFSESAGQFDIPVEQGPGEEVLRAVEEERRRWGWESIRLPEGVPTVHADLTKSAGQLNRDDKVAPGEWDRRLADFEAKLDARMEVVRRAIAARASERACLDPTGPERPGRRLWALLGIVAILGALLLWPVLAWLCG